MRLVDLKEHFVFLGERKVKVESHAVRLTIHFQPDGFYPLAEDRFLGLRLNTDVRSLFASALFFASQKATSIPQEFDKDY